MFRLNLYLHCKYNYLIVSIAEKTQSKSLNTAEEITIRRGGELQKYFLITIIIILTACAPKYDVHLSEVSFSHDESSQDTVTYHVSNPTDKDLNCELTINPEGIEKTKTDFFIKAGQERKQTALATLPQGETRVILSTRCKPAT